jgi:hypothetical protein
MHQSPTEFIKGLILGTVEASVDKYREITVRDVAEITNRDYSYIDSRLSDIESDLEGEFEQMNERERIMAKAELYVMFRSRIEEVVVDDVIQDCHQKAMALKQQVEDNQVVDQ